MKSVLERLTDLSEQGRFCFHGSAEHIGGFIKPHQAHGPREHEQHRAVYASTDYRVALAHATVRLTGTRSSFATNWNGDFSRLIIDGYGVSFQEGYVYVLDKNLFVPSGSDCGLEYIATETVRPIDGYILVQKEDLLKAPDIQLEIKDPPLR